MTWLLALTGTCLVVLLPGAAAAFWAMRRSEPPSPAEASGGAARVLALAYSGVALASIALWLAAQAFGLSPWTSIGAPLGVSALVIADALRGARNRGRASLPSNAAGPVWRDRAVLPLAALGAASMCLVALPFAPYGLERADGVHRMAMTDWEKHIVMATGIAASPVFPPPHPYLHADPEPSYYFGYQLTAAAVDTIARTADGVFPPLLLLTLLTAAATPFVVYLFATDLCSRSQALLAAGAATLLVGFDLIVLGIDAARAAAGAWPLPGGLAGLRAVIPSTHIDYWLHNVDRSFSPPVVATMWAPHQTAAALVALLALYLLAPRPGDAYRARSGWLLPALLVAALPALSSYLALALGAGVAGAAIAESAGRRIAPWRTGVFRRWLVPGVVAVVLALPVFPVILRGSSAGLILHLSPAGSWSNGAVFSWLFGAGQWTSLFDTPAILLIELGVIGLLCVPGIRRLRRDRAFTPVHQQSVAVAVSVLLLTTFVRPPVDIGNNLYARALLLVWFVLAPFAVVGASGLKWPRWVRVGALLGALGTAYVQAGYLLEGTLFWATPAPTVDALRWVNANTDRRAVVAIRPADYENNHGYWLRRPLVAGSRRLALLFGADPGEYDRIAVRLEAAYAQSESQEARRRFDDLSADVVLVRTAGLEPAWAAAPCFDVAYRNAEWTVVRARAGACASSGSGPE